MQRHITNAVLVPYMANTQQILVQDRRGHRPPPWGYFGGGIESGETPLDAVVREAWEELGVQLSPQELRSGGEIQLSFNDLSFNIHVFAWAFHGDLTALTLGEGAAMELVSVEEMKRRVEPGGPDDQITRVVRTFLLSSGAST